MGSKKIRIHKNLSQFLLVGFFVSLSFIIGKSVFAIDMPGFVTDIIGWIAIRLVELFGVIFVWFVDILIDIAQFNKFTNLAMVETGWGLARDVANMFFIVVLLIIAFSTVLKISSYHYQKTLGKLIIMAVLINFSKLIAGFLIDFFQVIMLTFVNGFKEAAAGNLATGFGMYDILAKSGAEQTVDSNTNVALAAVLALIMIVVADMIVLILIAVLMWRVAMLWILVIISPLAYLSYSFIPKYWSQWWQEFFKHLVSGPVIAFFLWLALLTMQQSGTTGIGDQFIQKDDGEKEQIKNYTFVGSAVNNGTLINYFVATALLLGGLAISQKIAAQSGGAVGNFAQKVQKYGTRAAMIGSGAAAAGWALKKGKEKGVDSLKGLATTSSVRGGLGYLASRRGIIGGALAATGIRRLATVGLAKSQVEKKAREDKQRNFYGMIKDTRVLERVANSNFNTASRRVVAETSPSLVHGPRAQIIVNDLSQEKINRLEDSELTSLGRRAGTGEIDINGTRLGNHLARNVNDKSLYNFGVEQSQVEQEMNFYGVDEATARANVRATNQTAIAEGFGIRGMVVGQNRDGHDLQFDPGRGTVEEFYNSAYGPTRVGHFDYDRALRRNNFDHQYRLADTDDMKKGRGAGNTSINKFSQGSSNAVAVDFDKLDKEKTDFLKNFDTAAEVKGVTLDTPDKITKAATQLAAILDDEVNKLRSSGGSEQDIQNLEQTRDRLGNPEKLSNLQLLNSSAHGYSNSDLKKTYIHEKMHGMGVTSEKDAESLTQGIIDNRLYSSLEKLATAVAGGKSVDAVIAAELNDISSGQTPPPSAKTKTEFTPSEEKIEIKAKTKSEIEGPVTPSPTRSSADEKKKPEEVKKTSSPEGVVKKESEGISKEVTLLAAIKKILEDKKKL